MCMVCLLHFFTTRARHSQGRMERPLHKKIEKSQISGIPDELFSTPPLHGHVNCFKEVSLEEIDTLLQEYENRYQKNILHDAKEISNDHDPTLVEYFDYVIQENQLNYPPGDWKEAKIMFETIIDCSGH